MPEVAATDRTLIYAIARQLPADGRWTQQQRRHWLDAMRSAVDLAIQIKPKPAG